MKRIVSCRTSVAGVIAQGSRSIEHVVDRIMGIQSRHFICEEDGDFIFHDFAKEDRLIPDQFRYLDLRKRESRRFMRMLNRVANIRISATHFSVDHHARLLMAYCVETRPETLKELSVLIKSWESIRDRQYDLILDEVKRAVTFFKENPELLPDGDHLTSYTESQLSEHCQSDINPMTYRVRREDTSRFFSYLSTVAALQKSVEPDSDLYRDTLKLGAAVADASKILVKFIEKNLSTSQLHVDHYSKTVISCMDAVWRFLVEIDSPGRTMVGLMDYQLPETGAKGIIISCSGGGQGLDKIKAIFRNEQDRFTAARITLELEDPSGLPVEGSSDLEIEALLVLMEQFRANEVSHIRFSANWVPVPFMTETPKVDKEGVIATHNGIACAFVKLFSGFSKIDGAVIKGVIETWYESDRTKPILTPYPATPSPDKLKQATATMNRLDATRELAGLTVEELSKELDVPNWGIVLESISPLRRAGLTSIPTTSQVASQDLDTKEIRRQRVSAALKTPRDSNGIGIGFVACSCFGCRYNKDAIATYFAAHENPQALADEAGPTSSHPSSPTSNLRDRRKNQRVDVTPVSVAKPSQLDISFEGAGVSEETEERQAVSSAIAMIKDELKKINEQIDKSRPPVDDALGASVGRGKKKAKSAPPSPEIKKLYDLQKKVRLVMEFLMTLAAIRDIDLPDDPENNTPHQVNRHLDFGDL